MSNTEKMAALLRSIRTATNGAVVGAMEARDMAYPLSYGVAVPDIRAAAAAYAPDHALAGLLYRQQVRELCIAATMVADPLQIRAVDLPFWAAGITGPETAGHVAMMLSRTPLVGEVLEAWTADDVPALQVYAALLAGAHAALRGVGAVAGWDFALLARRLQAAAGRRDYLADKGVVALVARLWERVPGSRAALGGLLAVWRTEETYAPLWNELEWRVEE